MGADRAWMASVAGAFAGGILMLAFRGFTVDDALISARYAVHIAQGLGPRFNAEGPVTDGVTPLGWPWLLAPFAHKGALSALAAAKGIGAVAWLASLALLVRAVAQSSASPWRHLGTVVAACAPAVAAWAIAGMETGLAMALATAAVTVGPSTRQRLFGSIASGLAASLRPEMIVWSTVIGLGHARSLSPHATALHRAECVAASFAPFAATCAVRWALFGSVAPLALRAKPSDLHHGLIYVAASLLLTGAPVAVLAPLGWKKMAPWPRWIVMAFAGHALVVTAVGGDWMPMSRLFAPVLPSLGLAFAFLTGCTSGWSSGLRVAACVAGQLFVLARVGPSAAAVAHERSQWIAQLRPMLTPSDRVASVDVGWVGASFDGTVVDLAGVTDPGIAALPGGHTTKAVTPMMLAERGVTKLVLLAAPGTRLEEAWSTGAFERGVERRLASEEWVRTHFRISAAVGTGSRRYAVLSWGAEGLAAPE